MALDSSTETISHFIGLFDLAIEELRLRDQYDRFKAEEAAEDEAQSDAAEPVVIKAPHSLKGPEAAASTPLPETGPPQADLPAITLVDAAPIVAMAPAAPEDGQTVSAPGTPIPLTITQAAPQFEITLPGSVATVTLQTLVLSDNDIVGDVAGFVPPEGLAAALSDAAGAADALNLLSPDWLDLSGAPTVADALTFADQIAEADLPAEAGSATVFLAKGADASDTVVNSQTAEEMPDPDTVLPGFLAPEDTDADAPAAETPMQPTGPVFTKAGADAPPTPEDPPQEGHQVVTGANQAINEVVVSTNWLDAPVIAVGGDVVNMAAVSQINVMQDRDTVSGHGDGSGAGAPSTAINAASITATSSVSGPGIAAMGEGLPDFWHVDRIEGDVTALNVFQQYTFATDTDRVEMSFSASSTHLGTGENLLVNSALTTQIGFAYDLIIIGGSMVTVNSVTQTNVLLDNDTVATDGPAEVSTHDNLVLNQAVFTTQGVDTYMELAHDFADTMRDMAQGAAELARSVAQNDLFEGTELLRALYIAGDLIKMNVVEQTNILGDQDQVSLALDTVLAGAAGPMSVTTGSNALINSATIFSQGMDSTVMAGGDVYEDALLYQAELIDIDGAPEGVSMTALANEAVAFLADDMLPPELPETEVALAQMFDGAPSVDVMQTVLA